jgi:hypothetical protein
MPFFIAGVFCLLDFLHFWPYSQTTTGFSKI